MRLANNRISRRNKILLLSFFRHDLKASVTVFFVALPLCLGISLASEAPLLSGIISGIIGGVIVSLISKSPLSVSGPAAGLTAICAAAIQSLGSLEAFYASVVLAGIFQLLIGRFKLAGFTHLIPASVIKGMLTAIGLILISKQIPFIIGYDKPDFWRNELFNIITFDHAFENIDNLFHNLSAGPVLIASGSMIVLVIWKRWISKSISFIPTAFISVAAGTLIAYIFEKTGFHPLQEGQYVNLPSLSTAKLHFPQFDTAIFSASIWKYAILIAFVASLETLLSIEAIDKIDRQNRITPQNREMIAQGTGNIISGILGGLPITAVIVRSSANAEAGAKTRLSGIAHGIWLFLAVVAAASLVNKIPYCVLAVILIRTGYNLAKPSMLRSVYEQGKEQFRPFLVTVTAILLTDLLIGVLIGVAFSLYYLLHHTYRAGFTYKVSEQNHTMYHKMELAMNVSFLNKRKIRETLDKIPPYSILEIDGRESVYIDHDILEIFQEFRSKARQRHIQLELLNIPEVTIIELH